MAAKKQKRPRTQGDVEPFKIVGVLIGAVRNDDGEIIAEKEIGQVQLYRSQFPYLEQEIERAMREAEAAGESGE